MNFEVKDYRCSGSMQAFKDWHQSGEFYNPYPKGSNAYFGYQEEKQKIELMNDLSDELNGRLLG